MGFTFIDSIHDGDTVARHIERGFLKDLSYLWEGDPLFECSFLGACMAKI